MKQIKVSIIILVHNAPKYVEETLYTLNEITNPKDLDCVEIIVLDNASDQETRNLLNNMKSKGYIDKLFLSDENTFFAKGNNIASTLSEPSSQYYLLLNSDVKIINSNWLSLLLKLKQDNACGIASYGYCSNPSRGDGYCFLIDKEYYDRYLLDEAYQWWWGLTKLQALLLNDGISILAIDNHNHMIYHYGGKSGKSFKDAKGMDTDLDQVTSWFKNSNGRVIIKSLSITQKIKNKIKLILNRFRSI